MSEEWTEFKFNGDRQWGRFRVRDGLVQLQTLTQWEMGEEEWTDRGTVDGPEGAIITMLFEVVERGRRNNRISDYEALRVGRVIDKAKVRR